MSAANVGWEVLVNERKSSPNPLANDRAISRQIDELERISQYERDRALGRDYFQDIEDFYNLCENTAVTSPSYKPLVKIPQLQTLVLNEATDISDCSPKVYILNNEKDERDKPREEWFQANWYQGCYNNRIMEAEIWAMLSNLGFLQPCFDPYGRKGQGTTYLKLRHPKSVYPDPYAKSDSDWTWLIMHDWMYIDDVWRLWPEKGRYVRPHVYASDADPYGNVDGALEFPELSPLSVGTDGGQERKIFRDNRVLVRHCYMFDNTREAVKEYDGTRQFSDLLVHPRFRYKYPDGRWITECEGVILADGNNWCPQLPDDDRGTFPLIRIAAMPTITNFWGPPPVQMTRSIQRLSERVYTQFFENIVRLNNGVIVIQNNTGLSKSDIGWIPGEVIMINQGSQAPQVISPQVIPAQQLAIPDKLLAIQKELQGFSGARQGDTGGGNISPDLFDAALWQSKPMTRMRGRLLAESLLRLSSILFRIMCRYQQSPQRLFGGIREDKVIQHEWEPIEDSAISDYDMHVDEGSLQVLSGTMLRSAVSAMAKANLLPTKTVLETIGIPDAEQIAEEKTRELELGAMAKLRKARG